MREKSDLEKRIDKTTHLSQGEKTVFRMLANEKATIKHITDSLICSPYGWSGEDVILVLNKLNQKGLLKIDSFHSHPNNRDGILLLTFSEFWIGKI